MVGGGEETGSGGGTENFDRMGIEGDGDGIAAAGTGIGQGAEEDGAMAEVNAVENADGQVSGSGKGGEVRDGAEEHAGIGLMGRMGLMGWGGRIGYLNSKL